MSMETYIKAGEVHIDKDEEIDLTSLKDNQKMLNGHVSMLLKFFNTGGDWNHQARLRESMLGESLAVCPLWLLFKCHKGWTWRSGKPPPTRPVAGGNAGMNYPLSEIVSWVLEPVASNIQRSSELISCEDLKSKIDSLNSKNSNWEPDKVIEGSLADQAQMKTTENPPKLCECLHNLL